MSAPVHKKPKNDETRLGVHSAKQPLSGVARVDETYAVCGNGRGGYVRKEDTNQKHKPRPHTH